MSLTRFLSRRLNFSKEKTKSIARPVINLVIFGIALSLCVMILSVAIVTGFKSEIKDKVVGFASHIQVSNLDNNTTFETLPISQDIPSFSKLIQIENIAHIQPFATKLGIIKTLETLQGVILQGVDRNYDWQFFRKNLVVGDIFFTNDTLKSNKIILSGYLSNLLKLNVGDNVYMHFVQEPPRMRKFELAGIYNTGMTEFDKFIVLCDMKHIQKLNGWTNRQISGYDIFLKDFSQLHNTEDQLYRLLANKPDSIGNMLAIRDVKERYPLIFDWLNLLDMNVKFILVLVLIVAGFNMISGLLVLILEKTNFIGILKSLGMSNWQIQKIFLSQAAYIISKGMILGNLLSFLLIITQLKFNVITLNPEMYYIDNMPVHLNFWHWLGLNVGTLASTLLMMIAPSYLITKISPVKAIRFD